MGLGNSVLDNVKTKQLIWYGHIQKNDQQYVAHGGDGREEGNC